MYRVISVEDDETEAAVLKNYLDRFASESGENFEFVHLKSAIEFLDKQRTADLIFFDIDLPGINGIEAATLLRSYDEETPIIFVTNLAQYAIKGYEVDALDFVVKPVGYRDFCLRMRKALRILRRRSGRNITVQDHESMRVFSVDDLAFVDISGHSLGFHCGNGDAASCRGSLREIEGQLADDTFVRISNSCLANLRHIRQVTRDGIVMTTGDKLYFSRSRKKPAMEAIASYLGGSQ